MTFLFVRVMCYNGDVVVVVEAWLSERDIDSYGKKYKREYR